jgi:isoquinoline 1-oxidoreductase alpha subunit
MLNLNVNGRDHALDVEPDMPLLWVLRDELGVLGPKYGCGVEICGACMVHVDGVVVRACGMPVSAAAGKRVLTIEGLAQGPLQEAWIEYQVPQCGYCQPGMLMAAAALLARNPDPSDADIDQAITNLCRCGTYTRVRTAIHAAAAKLNGRK